MSNTIKKISSIGLSVTTAVWLSGAAMFVPMASAATIEELQAQISALLVQIQALQTQLTTAQPSAAVTYNFTRDLTLGSKGDDVKALQQFLNSKGFAVAASGAGSSGNETTYFGSLTQAALAKYQASVGISPTAGYFGPKSRAYVASLAAAPTTPTTPGVTPPAGEALAVALASDSPSARTIGSGTAFNSALKVNLTAGSKDVKVTSITILKSGFLANTRLNGIDVIDSNGVRHGNVITSINADNTVVITMSTDPIIVAAGKSGTITVRFNLISGDYTGTIIFSILAASSISSDAASVSGTFPISGNAMNIASGVTALASSTLAVLTTTGSSTLNVNATDLQEITRFRITEASNNEAIKLSSLTLYNYGSAADGDVKDVTLLAQDGTTVLATSSQVSKYVKFVLSTLYEIAKGTSKDFIVKAKIVDGAGRNISFVVYNDYDAVLQGATTGALVVPLATGDDTSYPVGNGRNIQTIGSGSLSFSRATDSPTASVTPGSSDVVLAKYIAKPTGENMELRQISFYYATSSVGQALLTGTIKVEVNGSTVYSVAASGISTGSASTVTLSNYPILTSGTDNTIIVKGSIVSTATSTAGYQVKSFDLIQVKRLTTNDLVDPGVSAQDGNTISVSAAAVSVTTLATPVADSIVAGTNSYTFAQIQLNAQSGGEDVNVTKVIVTQTNSSSSPANFIKSYALYKDSDTSPLATTASTESLSSNAVTFNLSSPLTVTRTTPVILYFKANILTGIPNNATSSYYIASSSNSITATGKTTGNTLTHGSDITYSGLGQIMTAVSSGQLLLSVVTGSGASPSVNQVATIGTSGGTYFAFKLTSLYEPQKITSLKITATSTGAAIATTTLANIKLYEGSASAPFASGAQFDSCDVSACSKTFTAADNLLSAPVPTTGVTIYVKADVSLTAAKLGDDFRFMVASSTGDIAIKGSVTGLTTGTKSGTATSTGITYVVPQKVTVSGVSPTTASTLGLSAGQTVGVFKVTNNGTAPIYFATGTITFANGGSATSSVATSSWQLYASNMGAGSASADTSYGTSSLWTSLSSSSVPFGSIVSVAESNRKIDGGSHRYLIVKTNIAAENNNTVQMSVNALGNILFYVKESDLGGYDANLDGDLNDTITGLYTDGTPTVEIVTLKT